VGKRTRGKGEEGGARQVKSEHIYEATRGAAEVGKRGRGGRGKRGMVIKLKECRARQVNSEHMT